LFVCQHLSRIIAGTLSIIYTRPYRFQFVQGIVKSVSPQLKYLKVGSNAESGTPIRVRLNGPCRSMWISG
jgi:hypothetical protein